MAIRPPLVAAAFGLQLVEHLPQEATDVKVDWIVTERETISCGQARLDSNN
jgi:5-formyltetrahydrofolate cyclo-ligase